MIRRWVLIACLILLAAFSTAGYSQSRPELRAFWVDGFNDGYKTPGQCDTLLARLRAAHCNAVFVQMRKRADAYYASHYEPWASDDQTHFDALEYLCRAAHQPGAPKIQVHAWVNACAIGGNKSPLSITKLHPDWYSLSDTGDNFDHEATKIDPGNPAAADWTYRVYLDIARHYDVDGIHLDFIRYGGSGATAGHWGYNAASVARYNATYMTNGLPKWDDPRWQAWRRDQVTSLVRRIYASATAIRPHLIVSAATICWGNGPTPEIPYERSSSYSQVYAPWRDWLQEGILDLNCPMTYFTYPKRKTWWDNWSVFIKDHQYNRLSAMGVAIYLNAVPDSIAQIQSTRLPATLGLPTAGAVLYSYASADNTKEPTDQSNALVYAALADPGVFADDVPPPAMPWKDHPKTGLVMGTLLDSQETLPASDGASVNLRAPNSAIQRTVRSDGNGFFAFVDVPPGDYTLDTELRGVKQNAGRVTVAAGKALSLLPGFPKGRVAGIGQSPDGAQRILAGVLVTSGSDRLGGHFYVADGFGKPVLRVDMPNLSPPTVAGDLVVVSGRMRHDHGAAVLDGSAVCQVGSVLIQ